MNSIYHFIDFCKREFLLEFLAQRVQDLRKRPRIPPSSIFSDLFLMFSFGFPSLLSFDSFLKRNKDYKIIPFQKKVSDSTLSRVISLMIIEPLRLILRIVSGIAFRKGYGRIEISDIGKVRVGIIDGSSFGNTFASVISIAGKIDIPIDLEPSSKILMNRLSKKFKKGFLDYLIGDGLYAYRDFFSQCIENLSCHGVVKTKEERLEVIESANQFFNSNPKGDEYIEHIKGIDPVRYERYEIWTVSEIYWDGLKYPLKIARIEEEKIKGIKREDNKERYYVITTDESLSGKALRELAKTRWHIENNTFKTLNEQFHTKHAYVRKEGIIALLLIIFIVFILLQIFKDKIEEERERSKEIPIKDKNISFRELRFLFLESLSKRREDTS